MWSECRSYSLPSVAAIDDDDLIANGRTLLEAILKDFPFGTKPTAELIRARTAGRFMTEWRTIAERLDVDWHSVALANASYDLAIVALGCSTAALSTPTGPILARNLDWWPEEPLARASVGLWVDHWYTAGWPGFSGVVTGLSKRGFALALNAIELPKPALPIGYPVLLMLRRALEDAKSFSEAVELLSSTRLLASALITVVGTTNTERVVIERSPTKAALRWADGDGPLVTTNDYRLLEKPKTSNSASIYQTTCARFDALTILAEASEESSDQALLEMLSDQEVYQSITVQQVILRPSLGEARVWVPSRLLKSAAG